MIVCGTRLDALDLEVERVAAGLAARLGTPLRLVHVSEDSRAPVVLGTDEEYVLGDVRQRLRQRVSDLAEASGAQVGPHLAAGSVVHALESVTRIELADLLIVGTGSGADWNVLGSTSERISRTAMMPVLAVRGPSTLASWLAGERPLRILVGADTGLAGTSARHFATLLGRVAAVDVTVAYVAEPEATHRRLGIRTPTGAHALHAEAVQALEKAMAAAAPPDESATLRILAGRGSPDVHLVSVADGEDFDLVVVGRRRESLLEQLWYGSVARGVLRSAPCSVACVPPSSQPTAITVRSNDDVVVGIDGFPGDIEACRIAMGSATRGGRVHLAHVVDAPRLTEDEVLARKASAWHDMTRLVAQLRDEAASTQVSLVPHVVDGRAVAELIALSRRSSAALLVLRRSQRSAAGRALLGSVARGITEESPIPVLLLPHRVS